MARKTNWFRVAVEGDTIDGRKISGKDLKDMADTYDPKVYGARVFIEHLRSVFPNSELGAYGDVLALKTEPFELMGEEKTALYAQIDALERAVEMIGNRQKVYSSIEIVPDFAKTGKAYLGGLALTDSPASLGTEMLTFSRHQQKNPHAFTSRQLETQVELEPEGSAADDAPQAAPDDDEVSNQPGAFARLVEGIKTRLQAFGKQAKDNGDQVAQLAGVVNDFAEQALAHYQQQTEELAALRQAFADLKKTHEQRETDLQQLKEQYRQIDATDKNPGKRPAATGGAGYIRAKC